MAEVKPSTSRGEDAVGFVEEASCSGADGSTSPESVPAVIAAESPSFLTWMWIQILTACSGVSGARGGALSGPRNQELASGAPQTQQGREAEVRSRIAASKSTWSEVPGRVIHHSVSVLRPSQLSVWKELKESAPDFFCDFGDDLEVGRLIAEGSQAQIFEAKLKGLDVDYVLKVFKADAGFSLADFKRHWPCSMRKDGGDCSESRSMQERRSRFIFENVRSNIVGDRCIIIHATLLKDGSFAFLMWRYWGDLRTLIDLKVETNTHPWEFDLLCRNKREQPPFSFEDSVWIMLQIARGLQGLHIEGVLHRDLKASNVLIRNDSEWPILCDVADYECAMFVQGTGFWRAPEVLQKLLKNEKDQNVGMWTKEVDVYSFGMTCYEILTGRIPFEGYTRSKRGDVINGERPFLPAYVFPGLRELVEACWHTQPSQRPSFDVIVEKLRSFLQGCQTCNSCISFFFKALHSYQFLGLGNAQSLQ